MNGVLKRRNKALFTYLSSPNGRDDFFRKGPAFCDVLERLAMAEIIVKPKRGMIGGRRILVRQSDLMLHTNMYRPHVLGYKGLRDSASNGNARQNRSHDQGQSPGASVRHWMKTRTNKCGKSIGIPIQIRAINKMVQHTDETSSERAQGLSD
jgi:hypothetical protein